MPTHTQLKGAPHTGDALVSDNLEANLVNFFNWGFLGAGGFFTVRRGDAGCYDGDNSRLRPVADPNYTDGTVWEAFRKDWVWESGVEYTSQPVRVSGVYVDGSFLPLGSGDWVDYPNGRVVLATPLAPATGVQCEYTYRSVQVYTADNPAWETIQTGSFRSDDPHFLQAGSGGWDVLAQNRVQLPAVFVEAVPDATREPLALGGGVKVRQTVLFHVLAEDRQHYKWLHDAITGQWEKRLYGFDKNALLAADAFPLDAFGTPRGSGLMYPDLVSPTGDYYWEQIRFADTRGVPQPRLGSLWYCTVRATMEVDRPE